ncbi:SPX-domain-containing protein [Xylona heveae TC161]|uniref:SPX-domain-containing protein n=1 Tax=Xylona heveae (strain CBS 132557 / TC161) TaxID=1328760 RepID=A0A165F9D3_XYLHT|nr:SPX-domain-containing protein [Xylona heveae TC161]KZF20730.1 SPX-domain-containing protein [Xylona heveae TC161]
MRFGTTLRDSIYPPWESQYIDYKKLKNILREDRQGKASRADQDDEVDEWTEQDEGTFVEELINVQLEKVNAFQNQTFEQLRERAAKCETRLEALLSKGKENGEPNPSDDKVDMSDNSKQETLREIMEELDNIAKEINELEKYSRINFTGFLKAAKKHDRKRGQRYRVKPLLQVRLSALPFNSENYSPLLYRLSAMYSFVRQHLEGEVPKERTMSVAEIDPTSSRYSSYKFWVHPDNLLEVKTYILRRLPVLVYNPQTSKVADGARTDPTITSLYFDNSKFSLYTQKVDRAPDSSSLRLRWFGQLAEQPEIMFEKKIAKEGDESEEVRFPIKEKYIQSFIKGDYKMEKSVRKLQDRSGPDSKEIQALEKSVDEIQKAIKENNLQPVLRANYTRTAFQIPGDDRVRISLDTELALIREDSFDTDRPCRDPEDWHRRDIDDAQMEFPYNNIRKGEISRFPYALLDIKVRGGPAKKTPEWVSDLMSSHLVKEAPRFSKFVHGVAQLFEDQVNSFPFWLGELDTDIRKDPAQAFEQEQEKKAKRAEDEIAVGSFLGSKSSPYWKPVVGSPADRHFDRKRSERDELLKLTATRSRSVPGEVGEVGEERDSDDDGKQAPEAAASPTSHGLASLFPSFSTSKYARARRGERVELPPGVRHPGTFIKDSGPVKVEAKVWLANQRTFIKWQHVSVLLASLSLGLYNAAGESNNVARILAIVYTLIAVFAGVWGWAMYIYRSRLIQERSGKDFDNVVGPLIICVGLAIALCLNFGFKYHAVMEARNAHGARNETATLVADMLANGHGLVQQRPDAGTSY